MFNPTESTNTFSSYIITVSIMVAAVFSGTVAIGAIFLVVYFVRKKKISSSDNGNGRMSND